MSYERGSGALNSRVVDVPVGGGMERHGAHFHSMAARLRVHSAVKYGPHARSQVVERSLGDEYGSTLRQCYSSTQSKLAQFRTASEDS